MKSIAVVILNYKGWHDSLNCLESLLSQDHENFRIILIDNYSENESVQKFKEYLNGDLKLKSEYFRHEPEQKKRNYIEYTHEEQINKDNLGVTKNFEKAILQCNGHYIALADQDDIWISNKIQILVDEMNDYSLIYSNAEFINSNNEKIRTSMKDEYKLFGLDSSSTEFNKQILLNSFILGCTIMFRQDIVDNFYPIVETKKNHDWWIILNINQIGKIKYVNVPLIKYRIHSNNYSIKRHKKTFKDIISIKSFLKRKKEKKILVEENLQILSKIGQNHNFSDLVKSKFFFEIFYLFKNYYNGHYFKTSYYIIKNRQYLFTARNRIINCINFLESLIRIDIK